LIGFKLKKYKSFKSFLVRVHWILSEQFGIDPLRLIKSIRGAPFFFRDWLQFRNSFGGNLTLAPCLHDRYQQGGSADNEYFIQDFWVAREIFQASPKKHVDIGSRVDGFVAHVASYREIEVFDVRPLRADLPGIVFKQANLMDLDSKFLAGDYCDSLSCLHAIEHFGLGRYGDPIDPFGYQKGIANMASLLSFGGIFYLSTPIGRERVEFNANWVFDPNTIISIASSNRLCLISFYVISGGRIEKQEASAENLRALGGEHYNLGLFIFSKE
jgi:hypothetical protein